MDRVHDGGKGWRERITPKLKKVGVVVIDPCDKPIDVGQEIENKDLRKKLKSEEKYKELAELMKPIRSVDLRFCDVSDFIIVYLDMSTSMIGTLEELFWANREKKPILVWCPQGKNQAPDWLFATVPHEHIFSTEEELLTYIYNVDCGEDKRSFRRWYHIDLVKATIEALNSSGYLCYKLEK
jgi:hypothetical protein